jgi:hypothetical protein
LDLRKSVLLFLAAVSILNAISLIALETWWMAGFSFILGGSLANLSRDQPTRFFKKTTILICLASMIAFAPVTLIQLTNGIRQIGNHAVRDGPQSLSYVTRWGLWWSAAWMSIGGVAYGAPYTVAEQFLMFWPGPNDRLWHDDFPNKAKKVRNYIRRTQKAAGTKNAVHKYDLTWRSYCEDNCDVGLALNGGDLTVMISNEGKNCLATARVSVSYKPQYRSSTILGFGSYRLRIDQAAYWALQELGWLFPYTQRYRWDCLS